MAIDWTVDKQIIRSVRRRGMIAPTDETFSDDDILELANEELQSYIVPMLLGVREEFLVATYDVTTTTAAGYTLPPRAVGRELRNVLWNTGNGVYVPLTRIEPEREFEFGNTGFGGPYGYKFENDKVVLIPAPASGGTLRMQYFIRPNQLTSTGALPGIAPANMRLVTSVAGTTVNTSGGSDVTFATGTLCDIVSGTPGFACKVIDLAAGTVAGSSIIFPTGLPSGVVAGDYVCLAQESPIAQLPVELMPLLAERTCFKVLEALGDPKASVQKQVCDEMEKQALRLLSPRSQGSARLIVPRNGPGGYYRGMLGRWRF